VAAFDPAVKSLPKELSAVSPAADVAAALNGADAAVVCTEWPQFRQSDWPKIVPQMRQPVFVDANRFLEKELKSITGVEHLSVGRATK
jgi:UDPglucose 6-dehydrogenase